MENKLETTSVGRLLVSLSIPMICAQLVTLLYNVVDRMFIGKMENGSMAMAGIGVAGVLVMILAGFSQLFGAGGAPLAAIAMGKKDNAGAERIMTASFSCLIVVSLLITAVYPFVAEPILRLFGASEEVGHVHLDRADRRILACTTGRERVKVHILRPAQIERSLIAGRVENHALAAGGVYPHPLTALTVTGEDKDVRPVCPTSQEP